MARIKILPPETARLIAAGEVIDRPAAALRELLDNALDSEASEIEVRVENGGIALLSVTDDGLGMDRDDLFMSILPHATSKISSADDLLTARTLGFRGEALASIATAARLEIVSKDAESPAAARLLAGPGVETSIQPVAGRRGTSVTVSNIFERYPARRQFLKRPQSEAALCRQVFAD
jgi:DNA mismatch repair protein MutL